MKFLAKMLIAMTLLSSAQTFAGTICYRNSGLYVANVTFTWIDVMTADPIHSQKVYNIAMGRRECVEVNEPDFLNVRVEHYIVPIEGAVVETCSINFPWHRNLLVESLGTTAQFNCVYRDLKIIE